MFTDKFFETDRTKKNFSHTRVRDISSLSDISRAHARENIFFKAKEPTGVYVKGRAVKTETAPENENPLPPPIPCPLCDCPAIWSSIYEPNTFRCCDCDPPPGGWHFRTGGWQFVARRSMIVLDRHPTTLADVWGWESFPRTNWDEELRLARAEQQRSAAA